MGTSSCSLFCGPKILPCSYDIIPFHCLSLESMNFGEKHPISTKLIAANRSLVQSLFRCKHTEVS